MLILKSHFGIRLVWLLIEAEYLRAGLAGKAAAKKYDLEHSGSVEIFLAALAWP